VNGTEVFIKIVSIDQYLESILQAPDGMPEATAERERVEDEIEQGKKYVNFFVLKTGEEVEYRRAFFSTIEEAEASAEQEAQTIH